jgi:oxygen-independent coproporphyrinogen-3 oxidase
LIHLPTRFKGQRMIAEEDIPLPETKLKILQHTINKVCDAGYIYIGMDHFALPDDELVRAQRDNTLQRNFQGYSTHSDCDLIGLGVSAIGKIGNTFAQNTTKTGEYEELIDAGTLPLKRGFTVDADDQLRAKVIQELMTDPTRPAGRRWPDNAWVRRDTYHPQGPTPAPQHRHDFRPISRR